MVSINAKPRSLLIISRLSLRQNSIYSFTVADSLKRASHINDFSFTDPSPMDARLGSVSIEEMRAREGFTSCFLLLSVF